MMKRLILVIVFLILVADPLIAQGIRVVRPGETFTTELKVFVVPDSTYSRILEAGLLVKNQERRIELLTKVIGYRDQTIEYKSQQVMLWISEAEHYRGMWRETERLLIVEKKRSRSFWRSRALPFAGGVATTVAIAWVFSGVAN